MGCREGAENLDDSVSIPLVRSYIEGRLSDQISNFKHGLLRVAARYLPQRETLFQTTRGSAPGPPVADLGARPPDLEYLSYGPGLCLTASRTGRCYTGDPATLGLSAVTPGWSGGWLTGWWCWRAIAVSSSHFTPCVDPQLLQVFSCWLSIRVGYRHFLRQHRLDVAA